MEPEGILGDAQRLQGLLAEDCSTFFGERRRLLEQYIAASPSDGDGLRQLQGMLDQVRISSGSPMCAARTMLGLLEDYVEALEAYARQCRAQSGSAPLRPVPDDESA
jgi:hypothetical protein